MAAGAGSGKLQIIFVFIYIILAAYALGAAYVMEGEINDYSTE